MEVQATVRRLGNSLGILFPAQRVEELELHEGDKVVAEVRKTGNPLKELFGQKHFSRPTEEILREARAELRSKWERD